MKSSESRTLVDLQFFDGEGTGLFGFLLDRKESDRAMELAETWLLTRPSDEAMLQIYTATAKRLKLVSRADAYLRDRLAARPVRIEWHRAYQGMHDSSTDHSALVAKYDSLLAATPTDSALLYLRGRIDPDQTMTRDFFQTCGASGPAESIPGVWPGV